MLELGVSQAQAQFTKILNQAVTIIDKKSKSKKAIILPYEEYKALLTKVATKESLMNGVFSKFTGILDSDFQTDDVKYTKIIK